MGGISRIISVLLRASALACSVIVAGLLGSYVHHVHKAGFGAGSRILYALSLSGISIFFALLLLAPLKFSFWAFPLDFAFFIMWIVAFSLLADLSPRCTRPWFTFSWRFAWGSRKCGIWRAALAFSFLAAMLWLASCLLGLYRTFRDRKESRTDNTGVGRNKRFSRDSAAQPMAESHVQGQPGQTTVPANNVAV
ncbi:uncharacterized protein DNG_08714 [Cephalotrichum gorgonifer]|uniref:MARVEL domain-containing protein n=1 Tax=Cephalotrichum gorgonifer TaxID=2041049 RepID=A0AAE8N719_9PEZI|nr:uncharacterized protein DNG_08714 [Cephalotrichum gorgonifer]